MSNRLCIKPKEAAALCNVSAPVMYEWCKRADFPSFRVGRAILIPVAALEQWLGRQAQGDRQEA